jgi:hypothetical protein
MSDNFSQMNPLDGVYSEFKKILNTLVIKYSYLAETYETFEIKKEADMYVACKDGTDTFFSYRNYSADELYAAGITDASKIALYTKDDGYLLIPSTYRDTLLQNRRNSIIANYVERNDYYRQLNGLPPINTPKNKFYYIPEEYAVRYGIDKSIPLHEIQDHYNAINSGRGDYFISILEGIGYITELIKNNPSDEYLKYIGSSRIQIDMSRKAKNFQLLYVGQKDISNLIHDEFIKAYEQARDYHVSVIFVRTHRNIIPYYDQFIALCIFCMTIELVLNRQFNLGIDRRYYNKSTLKFLYDAYGVPYNMNIDDLTQQTISQTLNLLIQEKSTDKVFYHIANILGFDNLKLHRFYLTKERKFDDYGFPIFATTEKFNTETGEVETIPDYNAMYDVYFQKVELPDTDFTMSYSEVSNRERYDIITDNDPFWWDDENTFNTVWGSEYNFVEAKYLSIGLSYKMTEIMYENILLFKLLMSHKTELDSVTFTLPKIDENLPVTLFDAVILLFCLMAKKHNLAGEIISLPTQVTHVLDYLKNVDSGDENLIETYSFNFDLFKPDNDDGHKLIKVVSDILEPEDAERFMAYSIEFTLVNNLSNDDKISAINTIFNNVKGLSNYLQYLMAKAPDRKTYEVLKTFYNTAYYSREVKSIFTIHENNDDLKRTAKTYFEFLYYYNPKLYSCVFNARYESQYNAYILHNRLDPNRYTLDNYIYDVEYGKIEDFTYSSLNMDNNNLELVDDLIYYYIDHIISRIEAYTYDLKFIYMVNDTSTPLETLLINLINFFKSFTVDIHGLDISYIMDLRSENTVRLFDELAEITKNLDLDEKLKLSYSDTIHNIESVFDENDSLKLTDGIAYKYYTE